MIQNLYEILIIVTTWIIVIRNFFSIITVHAQIKSLMKIDNRFILFPPPVVPLVLTE